MTQQSFRRPRGTQDLFGDQVRSWRTVEETFRSLCAVYGYREIRTPVFESRGLFERSVGDATDIVEKQMFRVCAPQDQGTKEEWVLRPEGTAPVARAVIENGLLSRYSLIKAFYIAPIFRYERPQSGRLRQHHQCGVEAVGSPDPALDGEVITLGWHFLSECGLRDLEVSLNSIGCLRPDCRPRFRLSLLEFWASKVHLLCPDCQRRLKTNPLRILDCKQEGCQKIARQSPKSTQFLCSSCRSHFSQLKAFLKTLNISFEEDGHLVRGLDYYTRTVFEIRSGVLGAQNTVLGGGRYDGLIEQLGGPPTPGVGFGCGIERVLLALSDRASLERASRPSTVFLIALNEEARTRALRLLSELRRQNIPCDMDYPEGEESGRIRIRSLKGQMRQADKRGAHLVLIIGEDELKGDFLTFRDMLNRRQWTAPAPTVIQQIARCLNDQDPSPQVTDRLK